MIGKLTNLRILELDDCALMYEPEFLISIHEIIPPLETLIMTTNLGEPVHMDIDYLIEVLDSIGNVKNLYINGYGFQYLLNNKEFRRPVEKYLNEDQTKIILDGAMEVINKKFPINSTGFEIVDNESGWSIKKEEGKAPMMTKLPYKCTFKNDCEWMGGYGDTCTKFFTEKEKLEEHMKCQYGHRYPNIAL